MTWSTGEIRSTPADQAVSELRSMLVAYAHRQHPEDPQAAVECAFDLLVNHLRAIACISPRTLAETQDHIHNLRVLERRHLQAEGDTPLELSDPNSEVFA